MWAWLFLIPLYLTTCSPLLSGHGNTWVQSMGLAAAGTDEFYGWPGHFLEVPLCHGIGAVFTLLGLSISIRVIFLVLNFIATVTTLVLLQRWAGAIAALFCGASLSVWYLWNGELYALPLALSVGAVLAFQNRRTALCAALWVLALLCHWEFIALAPFFGLFLTSVSVPVSFLLLVLGGWTLGTWHTWASLCRWFGNGFGFELFTGFSPLGARFGPDIGLLILAATAIATFRARKNLRPLLLCLPPFTVAGLALQVATGTRNRKALALGFTALFTVNLFAFILPAKHYGDDVVRFQKEIRAMGDRAALVSCNGDEAIYRGPNRDLVLRDIASTNIHGEVLRWVSQKTAEGKTVYTLGQTCDALNMDLRFLDRVYRFHPTEFRQIPLNWTVQSNPYNWKRVDLYRLDPK